MPRWRRVTPDRWLPAGCMVLAIGLLGLGVASVAQRRAAREQALDQALLNEVGEQTVVLDEYFARARSITLITARNPAFAQFYTLAGTRGEKLQAGGPVVAATRSALANLELLFPDSIGEACFIDCHGERERPRRRAARTSDRREPVAGRGAQTAFFAPTFALDTGEVLPGRAVRLAGHARVGHLELDAYPVMPDGQQARRSCTSRSRSRASAREAAKRSERFEVQVLDGADRLRWSWTAITSSARRARRCRWASRATAASTGSSTPDARAASSPSTGGAWPSAASARHPHNANEWIVVACADAPVSASFADGVGGRAVARDASRRSRC